MAATDVLAIVVRGDTTHAVGELRKVGAVAEREMGRATRSTEQFAATATKIGTTLVGAAVVGGAAIAKLAGAASDLEETVNKAGQVFGGAAGQVRQFARTAATELGQSQRAALDAASTFGTLFRAIGLSEEQTAAWSIRLTKLASDLASFNNASPEEAVLALGAALRGEAEPIRRFGVLLNDAVLKQKALDLGLVQTTTGTLPPAIRAQAAYAVILEQTKLAQGDFARTQNSLANQQRILRAQIEDLAASFGESMLPAVTSVVATANKLLGALNDLDPSVRSAIGSTAVFATGLAALVGAGSLAAGTITRLSAGVGALGIAAGPAAAGIAALGGVFLAFQARSAAAASKLAQIRQEMAATGRAAKDVTEEIVAEALSSDRVVMRRFEMLGLSVEDATRAVTGSAGEWRAWKREIKEARAAALEQGQSLVDLDAAVQVVTRSTERWRTAAEQAGAVTAEMAKDYTSAKLAAAGFASEQWSGVRAAEQAAQAAAAQASAAADAAAAARDWEEALRKLRENELERLAGAIDWERQWDQTAEAFDRAREAVAELAKVTGEDLPEQQRRARAAILDAAEASADLQRRLVEASGGTQTAASRSSALVDALREIRRSITDEGLLTWLDQLIGRLQLLGAVGFPSVPELPPVTAPAPTSPVTRSPVRPTDWQPRAAGGPVSAQLPYLVGEVGPELFVPATAGSIIPTGDLMRAGRPVTIEQHFHERVDPRQVAAEIAWVMG